MIHKALSLIIDYDGDDEDDGGGAVVVGDTTVLHIINFLTSYMHVLGERACATTQSAEQSTRGRESLEGEGGQLSRVFPSRRLTEATIMPTTRVSDNNTNGMTSSHRAHESIIPWFIDGRV